MHTKPLLSHFLPTYIVSLPQLMFLYLSYLFFYFYFLITISGMHIQSFYFEHVKNENIQNIQVYYACIFVFMLDSWLLWLRRKQHITIYHLQFPLYAHRIWHHCGINTYTNVRYYVYFKPLIMILKSLLNAHAIYYQ